MVVDAVVVLPRILCQINWDQARNDFRKPCKHMHVNPLNRTHHVPRIYTWYKVTVRWYHAVAVHVGHPAVRRHETYRIWLVTEEGVSSCMIGSFEKSCLKKKRWDDSSVSLGVPQGNVLAQVGEYGWGNCTVTLTPHEFIHVGCQHFLMNPLHPLERRLHSVPVGLNILSMNASNWINEVQGVVDHVVLYNWSQLLHAVHESLWTMLPLRRCRSIISSSVCADRSGTVTITPRAGNHYPKYPNLLCSRTASVILQIHMGFKIHYRSNPVLYLQSCIHLLWAYDERGIHQSVR